MREWITRLADRFRRDSLDAELEEELRFHRAQLERDAKAAGVAPEVATAAAARALGNTTRAREEARSRWSWPWLDHLEQDVRYALRGLRRSPAFALSVVLTLGLGIGANAAIFSVVDRLLFRAPPLLLEPARVSRVYASFPLPDLSGETFVLDAVSYPYYLDLVRWTTSFDAFAATSYDPGVAVGTGFDARELPVAAVSPSFFGFFDARPALGRYFTEQENQVPAGEPVAILSDATWQARYSGRADVLGTKITIGSQVYTVIGVAPRGFVGLWAEQPPIAFVPFAAYTASITPEQAPQWWSSKMNQTVAPLVRRKPGVSVQAASSDLTAAMLRSWDDGQPMPAPGSRGAPLRPTLIAAAVLQERGPNQTGTARVAALVGAMALVVLLIAAANVANLMLTRALQRRREIAVRLAIGVSRRRLLSQLLSESLLLSALGGLAGLALAQWGGAALRAVFLPRDAEAPVITDTRTLVFVAIAVVVAGIGTGIAPVWQAWRVDVTRYLKSSVRDGGRQRSPLRVALLVLQGAFSVMLLVGAGLFARSLTSVKTIPLGYDVAHVLWASPQRRGVALDSAQIIALRDRLADIAGSIAGVDRVAVASYLPLTDGRLDRGIRVPGAEPLARPMPRMQGIVVSPNYFATIGTRILRGRGITSADVAGAPGALVVSERVARLLWPGKDAIGQCVTPMRSTQCEYVVGVAEDVKADRLTTDAPFMIYRSIAQVTPSVFGIAMRMRSDPAQLTENVRQALQQAMPGEAYVNVTPYADVIGAEMKSWRLGTTMFVAFGGLALLLAAIGLYGVVSYNVAQRTHEMGVRRALGAQLGDVLGLVLRQGVVLGALGVAIGVGLTLALAGRIAPLLFRVSPRDPVIYGAVAAAMLVVAVIASAVPAYRAARVDPNLALQSE